ncbi:ethionine resistance protein, partial [Linderina macrospora]
IYSTDPEVIACVALIMPVSALFQISDAVSAVTGGALRSLGRQRHGACINFPCFYLIGFPLSIFFAYGPWKLGIIGLWAGLSIGVTMAAIGQTYICVSADFQHEVDRCMRQVSSYKDVAKDDSTGAQGMASEDRNASTATLASEV